MKLGDAPAYPAELKLESLVDGRIYMKNFPGFTKREVLAKDFMCAMLSNPGASGHTEESGSALAFRLADIFLKESLK